MNRSCRQALCLLCCVLGLGGPVPGPCQEGLPPGATEVRHHRLQERITHHPGAPAAVERAASEPVMEIPMPNIEPEVLLPLARPDEGALWTLYRQRRETELDRLISRYRRDYPGWSPPRRLLRLRTARRVLPQVLQAREERRWHAIIEARHQHPWLFRCPHVDAVWALAEALVRTGDADAAQSRYRDLIEACADPQIGLASLHKAEALLDADRVRALYASAQAAHRNAPWRSRVEAQRYRYEQARLHRLLDQGVPSRIEAAIQRMSSTISGHEDAIMARRIGWFYAGQGTCDQAAAWFRRAHDWGGGEDAAFGLALSLERLGRHEAAARLARGYAAGSPRMEALLGRLELHLAWQDLEQGRLDRCQERLNRARCHLPDDPQIPSLQAWLDLRQGKTALAAQAFESLYRADPGPEYARGLAQSQRSAPLSSLKRLQAAYSGPLEREMAPVLADTASWRKHFLYAESLDPGRIDALHHVDSAYLELGGLFRHKSGDRGMDRLALWRAPSLEATTVVDKVHALSLTVSQIGLDSGRPKACAPIGSLPVQLSCTTSGAEVVARNDTLSVRTGSGLGRRATDHLSGSQGFELSYRRDGWTRPFLSIGITPTNGVVDPRLTFRLGLRQELDAGHWQLQFLSQPVRDSILSYTGIVDPYGGTKWGRVLRTGLEGHYFRPLGGRWSVYTRLQGAVLEGKAVKQNWSLMASAGLGYELALAGFDYFSVGPGLSYQHYDNNQNHFTLGHGGYFSPQQFVNLGPAVDFLTTEGRPFVIRGRLAVGLQYYREDESPWFAQGLDGISGPDTRIDLDGKTVFAGTPVYPDNDDLGPSYQVEMKGAWLFHPHWQLGGGFALRKTNGYEDYSIGAFLRLYFDRRHAVFSSDIPGPLFESVY